ncbi:unnamed protein product [Chondrus crispus]|uniref:BAR domain-containing protein n=1 Tax=Chondrus crispus TaxID=2769 RepID=R7Q3F8_CHOCR|nr:unnamed protein product [Chondrus crispus]CDF32544.1 unnamed protein product [Chondrus crispus]|eukprot:XP_005712209.1 unnamed protein product [Chondrus crispus]
MLHVIKRTLARAQEPIKGSPNAEYSELKHRLHSVKLALVYTCKMLSSANRGWVIQMQEQRNFSERFFESYPTTDDEIHQVAADFAKGSQVLYDQFTRAPGNEVTQYNTIQKQVEAYIREINRVEAMYSRLNETKSEASRYQSKLDFMERSRRGIDEQKKIRNLQKMDHHKVAYKALLADTVRAQKEVYAKHSVVFKAALTSYWLSHEKHVTLLVKSLENTQAFAKKAEPEMLTLDIANWTPPSIEQGTKTVGVIDYTPVAEHERNSKTSSETETAKDAAVQLSSPTAVTVESPTGVAEAFTEPAPTKRKEITQTFTNSSEPRTDIAS